MLTKDRISEKREEYYKLRDELQILELEIIKLEREEFGESSLSPKKGVLTKLQIEEKWIKFNCDFTRIVWLRGISSLIPSFKINIDNNSVYLTFDDEADLDEPMILKFEGFSNSLISSLFQAIGFKAELV
jgi:hypothetical protein